MQASAAELRDFAERYTTAWCSQDAARVASFYSSNGSLKVNDGDPAVGRRAIADLAQSFMTAFPNLLVSLDDLVIASDHVEYHWTLTGTNTGPGGTGNQVRISGCENWRIGPGLLIESSTGTFDAAEYARQLERGSGIGR